MPLSDRPLDRIDGRQAGKQDTAGAPVAKQRVELSDADRQHEVGVHQVCCQMNPLAARGRRKVAATGFLCRIMNLQSDLTADVIGQQTERIGGTRGQYRCRLQNREVLRTNAPTFEIRPDLSDNFRRARNTSVQCDYDAIVRYERVIQSGEIDG